jgi:subtilisin family serine protease
VVIAITDVNYHTNHEELVGKYTVLTPNASTDYTHGTAVAIAAAGNTGNNQGKSAIGYFSSLQLRPNNYNEVLAASYSGAHIVNMSWAAGCAYNVYAQQAIDEAHANGTVLVASAGNGSTCGGANNLVYPAAYNHVIAVSSVGPNDNHERIIGNSSTTHQHNASVDICAPGYDVAISTAPGVYTTGSGTSFAAPLVSGTIALMLAKNPCLTPDQVEYILKTSAVNIDALNPNYIGKLGAGRLDAEAALIMAANFSTYTVQGTTAVECSNMTQSISLDLANVPAPFAVRWNTNDTSVVLGQLQGGTYSATIKDANGCVASFSTSLDTILPIVIETSVSPVLCNGMNNGTVDLMVAGGTGTYTYNWSNGAANQTLSGLTAGTYAVEITDEKGCTSEVSVEVTEPAALQSNVAVIDGNIELTVTGGTFPYNYEWNNGTVESNINEATPGFYEVLVTDANGCMVSSNTTVEETSTAGIEEGSNVEFNVYPNPAKDNATIQWNNAEVSTVELINLTGTVVQTIDANLFAGQTQLNGVATGEYLVRITTTTGQTHMNKVIFL